MNKLSLPSPQVMHEYLLVMGEEWVCETYDITGDDIDKIIYGGTAVPTEERNQKKVKKAFKEDSDRQAYMNDMYKKDHFIWNKPWKKHIRCQNAEENPPVEITDEFLEKWTEMYLSLMEWDMKINNNCMKLHGWSHGERIINKTSSMTTDDDIHNRMIRYLEAGSVLPKDKIEKYLELDHEDEKSGHNLGDEIFLDFMESETIEYRNQAIKHLDLSLSEH